MCVTGRNKTVVQWKLAPLTTLFIFEAAMVSNLRGFIERLSLGSTNSVWRLEAVEDATSESKRRDERLNRRDATPFELGNKKTQAIIAARLVSRSSLMKSLAKCDVVSKIIG